MSVMTFWRLGSPVQVSEEVMFSCLQLLRQSFNIKSQNFQNSLTDRSHSI